MCAVDAPLDTSRRCFAPAVDFVPFTLTLRVKDFPDPTRAAPLAPMMLLLLLFPNIKRLSVESVKSQATFRHDGLSFLRAEFSHDHGSSMSADSWRN